MTSSSAAASCSRLDVHMAMGGNSMSSPEYGMSVPGTPLLAFDVPAGRSDSSSDSQSPELSTGKASDRDSRVLAEKHRRSQFNSLISQIMSLLADVVHSQRKIDKTSVLRLAANELRNEHVFGKSIKCCHLETWSPAFLKFFDLFGSIMLTVTCRGKIVLVSPNVQEKLGHCYIDLLAQDIYNYVHPEDREILKQHIYPPELQNGCNDTLLAEHHNFCIRIMRAGTRSEPPCYERCRIDGVLKRADHATTNVVENEKLVRRARVRTHRTFSSSGNDFVFIGMIHILSSTLPARLQPPAAYSEYWSRHLIDGRIVQCDQSISLAVGYMTEEVTGTSPFVFMHKDDVRWVICVIRQMYDQSKEFGESYYRLMSRSGHFIYMKTRGFLEIDRDTKKVQSFVCVNTVVNEDYGKKMILEMKRKYSVVIEMENEQTDKSVMISEDIAVEHPQLLERIVMHLVEPSVSDNFDELKLIPPSKENIISAIKNSEKVVQETGVRFESRKRKQSNCDDRSDNLKRHSGY